MPAPPARMRSASVPCGLNSISSSPGEVLVLAHVGRDHLLHLARVEELAQAHAVDARIVGHDGQALHAGDPHRLDQLVGDPAQPEAAAHDHHVVPQEPRQGARRIRKYLFHQAVLPGSFVVRRVRAAILSLIPPSGSSAVQQHGITAKIRGESSREDKSYRTGYGEQASA